MAIMTRMIRLWKADFNGLIDEIEDKRLLLKQYLREMEEALGRKKLILSEREQEREQLTLQLNLCRKEREDHENDLKVAISKDKDQIARMLIRKIKLIDRKTKIIEHQLSVAEQEIRSLRSALNEQQGEFDQLRRKARDYMTRQGEKNTDGPASPDFLQGMDDPEPEEEEIELELMKYKERFQTHLKEDRS